jgi:cell division protein FtsA
MAGIHFDDVIVGITGDHIRSTNNRAVVAVSGEDREVTPGDVRRVIDASKIINLPSDRQIIHALPRYFTVDGQEGVNDPVGMAGGRLEVDTHIVTGSTSFISNVLKCVQRAGLGAHGVVFEPLASSAATLMPEEKQVGVVLLDIGGGTTDVAVYSLGSAIYTATIPVGGNVLTSDISLGLKTTLAEAEDVKKRLGAGERDERFEVRTLDGRSTREHTTAELRQIVMPRVLETLRMARQKIVENVPRDLVLGEVVLTGGGAALPGIAPIAEEVFGLPIRIGSPNTIGGLTDTMAAPQYATAVGLVLFGANGNREDVLRNGRRGHAIANRVQRWLADLWT